MCLLSEVNVRVGPAGWHKRINRSFKSVARTAQLNDNIEIDPSRDVVGKIHNSAKEAVLTRKESQPYLV